MYNGVMSEWQENSKFVLNKLDEISEDVKCIKCEVNKIKQKMPLLEFKNTIFGTLGGSLTVLVYWIYEQFKSSF